MTTSKVIFTQYNISQYLYRFLSQKTHGALPRNFFSSFGHYEFKSLCKVGSFTPTQIHTRNFVCTRIIKPKLFGIFTIRLRVQAKPYT